MSSTNDISKEVSEVGFGDVNFSIAVYIANKPNMQEYQELHKLTPLLSDEINL